MSEVARRALFAAARLRAAESPFFLARDLAAYLKLRGLTGADLADALGCSVATLDLASLCRSPDRDSHFRADVEAIAQRFGIDPIRLAALLRESDALSGFESTARSEGWLAAARDRESDDDER